MTLRAAIFDLDGLLIDSEPLWQRVEIEVFAMVGVELDGMSCRETTGLRIDEVVSYRFRQRPWRAPTVKQIEAKIVDKMVARIAEASRKPGADGAIEVAREAGLRLAVASSSPSRLVHAALEAMGVLSSFEVVASAEDDALGKPHPSVFLRTAGLLGVEAVECVVLEDSLNGVIAAKAARMRCVAVPEHQDLRLSIADVVLPSLTALNEGSLLGG